MISAKPYSFVSFHWSVNLCFCRKSLEYGDSRAVLVKKKVFTKIEMENALVVLVLREMCWKETKRKKSKDVQ